MIFVQCTFLSQDFKPVGLLNKEFDSQGDFNAWYSTAKRDQYCVINFMRYNPKDNPRQAADNERMLLMVPRNMELAV